MTSRFGSMDSTYRGVYPTSSSNEDRLRGPGHDGWPHGAHHLKAGDTRVAIRRGPVDALKSPGLATPFGGSLPRTTPNLFITMLPSSAAVRTSTLGLTAYWRVWRPVVKLHRL